MLPVSRFTLGADSNSSYSAYRALVFADAAPGTPLRVNLGLKQPHLQLDVLYARLREIGWQFLLERYRAGAVRRDPSPYRGPSALRGDEEIAGPEAIGQEDRLLYFDD